MSRTVELKTSDGKIIKAQLEVLKSSRVLSSMIQLSTISTNQEPIYLEKISSTILTKVLRWCEHHQGEAIPEVDEEPPEFGKSIKLEPWDRDFLNVDHSMLFELIVAANFLDIPKLQDQICKTIAAMIKGKSTEEIRSIFNIKNDFTPEEEDMLRRENDWIKEFSPQFDVQRNR